MELLVGALEVARLSSRVPFVLREKCDVKRRSVQLADGRGARSQQHRPYTVFIAGRRHEEARSGDGREGHRGLQLRIIVSAGPLQSLRPALIEDVFALTMVFQIKRQNSRDSIVFFDDKMTGPPPRPRRRGARLFDGCKKLITRERMRVAFALGIGARVPRGGTDRCRRSSQTRCKLVAGHASSNTASTSVATLRGSEPAPTAARA